MRLTIPVSRVSRAMMRPALEALTRINETLLPALDLPNLYGAGVRYAVEPPGREDWDPADVVHGRGWGDCEDLAAWRAAELRLAGEDDARADTYVSRVRPDGSRVWHAIVVRADGTVEDPSAHLGMRRRRRHVGDGTPFGAAVMGQAGGPEGTTARLIRMMREGRIPRPRDRGALHREHWERVRATRDLPDWPESESEGY